MKPILKISACILSVWIISVISCKKDKDDSPNQSNKPPVANAGPDTTIFLSSCLDKNGIVELDGSASSDPDNNISYYHWALYTGQLGSVIYYQSTAKPRIEKLSPGDYVFELTVYDKGGLSSKDQVTVLVKALPDEYNLDLIINGNYYFQNDVEECDFYYGCSHYDFTGIQGIGSSSQTGDLSLDIREYADTSDLVETHQTFVQLYKVNNNQLYVSGDCSVNFKKLIRQGGSSFSGTFKITGGSAMVCDPYIFSNLPALTVSGNLSIASKTVTLRIQGKVFF